MKKIINNTFRIVFFKDFFQTKYNTYIIFFSFLICLLVFSYYLSIPDLSIFPKNRNTKFKTYTDKNIGGNSEVTRFYVSDSVIDFDFILKDSAYVHYVGISFFQEKWKDFDLSDYNQFKISIKSIGIKDIGIYLYTPNVFNDKLEEICFFENIRYVSDKQTYTIDFDDFKVPNWWYDLTKISQNENIPVDYKHIHFINIGNAYTDEINIKNSFHIYSIILTRNNSKIFIILILAELLIVLSLLLIHYIMDNIKKRHQVLVEYKAIDIVQENNHLYSFLDYINNNFNDYNLTLEQVSENTGVNHRRITNYIQRNYNCNFKTYLNKIRIEESKRILLSTELNIGEISYKVGFNSQSYYNHVFKIIEGVSPTRFRENFKNKI